MGASFEQQVITVLRQVPEGKVVTYGQVARLAGNPRAARQVVRILHTCSEKEKLPWHRVVNREGHISLRPGQGYELQKALLKDEGVAFGSNDAIDLGRHGWREPFATHVFR